MQEALRIKKQIDSEMLYLPELKHLIGRNAEIIIAVEPDSQPPHRTLTHDISELEGFLKPPPVPVTIEEMNAVIRSRGADTHVRA